MRRFDFLPSYHYEDNTDGIINNPAELALRDYIIEGNCGKNLIRYPYAQKTIRTNGITFTDNGDGTITINGTATAIAIFYINYVEYPLILEVGNQYTLSGGKSYFEGIILCLQDTSYKQSTFGGTITANYEKYYAFIRVNEGTTVDNFILKPQLELGETATEYEQYKSVGDLNSTDNKYHIPIVCGGKNLISYPYTDTTKTENGITFTDNGDGSVTVDGTTTATAYFSISDITDRIDRTKKYILSGGETTRISVYITLSYKNAWKKDIMSWNGASVIVDFPSYTDIEYDKIIVNAYVPHGGAGITVNDVTIKPQLELGTVATEYEPYIAPRTTNIILDRPLGPGKSISKKADNLPDIVLNKDSNIITVDTEVKPKATTYQYYTY